jgi:lipid intermediate transporter
MPICIEYANEWMLGMDRLLTLYRCRYPVQVLYTTYSKADDKALGKGVRLTQCPRCKKFADKYVEHDLVVLFIDLVLIKPQVCSTCTPQQAFISHYRQQSTMWHYISRGLLVDFYKVYRHLLFNLLGREDGRFDVRGDQSSIAYPETKI